MNNFYKRKLKNGLTVLFEKRNLPIISVSSSIKFGSAFEPLEIKGISHFIEHLMFKGTKTRSAEEIAREVEKKGGILNAFTAGEVTSYWDKMPSKHADTAIEIVSDLILNPKFDPVEFEKEKQVIVEEIKMYHDNPAPYSFDKIKEILYEKPFGLPGTGKAEVVKSLKREEVVDFFNKNYSTNNMLLTVVGDADFDEICQIAEKIYPAKKKDFAIPRPNKINKEEVEKRKGIDQAHFTFGFHVPSLNEKGRYAYNIAEAYLSEGMSSRLFQEIREKRGLAYAVKGVEDIGSNYGYFVIYAGTVKEKIKEIKELILKEFKKLKEINGRDFEETKEQVIGSDEVEKEDSSNAMNSLMIEEASGKGTEEYYKYEERINAVKLDDVKKIKLDDYSSFSLIPE
jgi:predicted Zn-dependent peptidase